MLETPPIVDTLSQFRTKCYIVAHQIIVQVGKLQRIPAIRRGLRPQMLEQSLQGAVSGYCSGATPCVAHWLRNARKAPGKLDRLGGRLEGVHGGRFVQVDCYQGFSVQARGRMCAVASSSTRCQISTAIGIWLSSRM